MWSKCSTVGLYPQPALYLWVLDRVFLSCHTWLWTLVCCSSSPKLVVSPLAPASSIIEITGQHHRLIWLNSPLIRIVGFFLQQKIAYKHCISLLLGVIYCFPYLPFFNSWFQQFDWKSGDYSSFVGFRSKPYSCVSEISFWYQSTWDKSAQPSGNTVFN